MPSRDANGGPARQHPPPIGRKPPLSPPTGRRPPRNYAGGMEKAEPGTLQAGSTELRALAVALVDIELEFLSRRWFRLGWVVDRETCLETLTDAWCHLLTEE